MVAVIGSKYNISVKKDLKKLFPKEITNRTLFSKYIDYVLNHFFQVSAEHRVDGFIGNISSFTTKNDYYIKELNIERQLHQLEPGVVTEEDVITYGNFINTLRETGAIVNNENRLLSDEYWAWNPGIDVDMFLNFGSYYWVKDGLKPIILNDKTNVVKDIIGKENYSYNGKINSENERTTIEFQTGLKVIFKNDENPEYNNIPYIISGVGDSIALLDDSDFSTQYELSDSIDVEAEIVGQASYTYEGYIDNELVNIPFYNGMKVIFKKDTSKIYNDKLLIVTGVGESIKLIDDSWLTNKPDYFVMERGCQDGNPWSKSNRWFHINLISNISEDNKKLMVKAKKPIICFNKDIQLYNYGLYDRGYVDLAIDSRVNDIAGKTTVIQQGIMITDGMKILLFNDIKGKYHIYDVSGIKDTGYIILQKCTNGISADGASINGESVFVKYGDYKKQTFFYDSGKGWIQGQQKNKTNQSPLFQLYNGNGIKLDDKTTYPKSSFKGSVIFDYKLASDYSAIVDKDLDKSVLVESYGNYIFTNNIRSDNYTYQNNELQTVDIKGYKYYYNIKTGEYHNGWELSTTPLLQFIKTQIKITDDIEPSYIPLDDNKYVSLYPIQLYYTPTPIENRKYFKIRLNGKELDHSKYLLMESIVGIDSSVKLTIGDVIDIAFYWDNKNDEPLINGYTYEIPLSLSANAKNGDFDTINYNETYDHIASILENQSNFSGDALGINNYFTIKHNLSLGTVLVQHKTSLVKTMVLTNNGYTNPYNAIMFVKNAYTEFKAKFDNVLNVFYKQGLVQDGMDYTNDELDIIIKQILNTVNIGKDGLLPFYNNGVATIYGDCYIPSTPAYLGCGKLYKPQIYTTKEANNEITILENHDGSTTSITNDVRDTVRLRLETVIYNSVNKSAITNDCNRELYKYKPGKFRTTTYSLEQYNNILAGLFSIWCNNYGLDYSVNDIYDTNDAFSWNYTGCISDDGEILNGSYRAIYEYYYDTWRPDVAPWEMLGFGAKPDWWDDHYGEYPYTSENIPLWADIENGYIADGEFKGYYEQFKRPGLVEKYIPVNINGELLNPMEIGIIPNAPIYYYAQKSWHCGDIGKIEYIWRKTSEFNYIQQLMYYLLKPADWVETTWNTTSKVYDYKNTNYNQIIDSNTLIRPTIEGEIVHNEEIGNTYYQAIGTQQWISDFILYNNMNITKNIGDKIRNANVQLMYRCGGYYQKDSLSFISDIYGLLPTTNYSMKLYKSKLKNIYTYSSIKITRVKNGYKIDGYDLSHPYFTVRVPYKGSKKSVINVGGISANYYSKWKDEVIQIPYKSVYNSIQDVYDIIVGYGKYLEDNEKWYFITEADDGTIITFTSGAKDFLNWCKYVKQPNDNTESIALIIAPAYKGLGMDREMFVDITGQYINGYWSVLDSNYNPINNKDILAYRSDTFTFFEPTDNAIMSIKIKGLMYEHIVLFDNKTVYGDIIYDPIKLKRISRLELKGTKVNSWNGSLYAPGYLLLDDGAYPNFDKLVNDFNYMFNTDDIRSYGDYKKEIQKIIGYNRTNYLKNMIMDENNEFNFYKGMLKEKGTPKSLTKINRSTFVSSNPNDDIPIEEIFAFKVGEFGNSYKTKTMEFLVEPEGIKYNPQIISFNTLNKVESDKVLITIDNSNLTLPTGTPLYPYNILINNISSEKYYVKGGSTVKWAVVPNSEESKKQYEEISGTIIADEDIVITPIPLIKQYSVKVIINQVLNANVLMNGDIIPGTWTDESIIYTQYFDYDTTIELKIYKDNEITYEEIIENIDKNEIIIREL